MVEKALLNGQLNWYQFSFQSRGEETTSPHERITVCYCVFSSCERVGDALKCPSLEVGMVQYTFKKNIKGDNGNDQLVVAYLV